MWLQLAVVATLMAADVRAAAPIATISYEIFDVSDAASRKSIARGERKYVPACDVLVRKDVGPRDAWSGSLELSDGFAIGATVYREAKLTGFGLVVERPGGDDGFSWDWFDLEQGNVFTKLQGAGRVAVEVAKGAGYEEMRSVEFLDDVTLRYLDDMRRPPGSHTHEIVVRKGSILRLTGGGEESKCPSPVPARPTTARKSEHSPAPAANKALEEVQLWLTYYYLNPRPDLALKNLDVMDREGRSVGHSLAEEVGRGGMRSFFARLFEKNPPLVADASGRMASLSADQQAFLHEALRRCETPACRRARGAGVESPARNGGPDPGTLDDAWGSFFATGDEKYIDEVITVLPWIEVRGDIGRLTTGGAAQWSLASNAHQHGRVLSILERRAVGASEPTRRLLNEIIESARDARIKNPPPEPR